MTPQEYGERCDGLIRRGIDRKIVDHVWQVGDATVLEAIEAATDNQVAALNASSRALDRAVAASARTSAHPIQPFRTFGRGR